MPFPIDPATIPAIDLDAPAGDACLLISPADARRHRTTVRLPVVPSPVCPRTAPTVQLTGAEADRLQSELDAELVNEAVALESLLRTDGNRRGADVIRNLVARNLDLREGRL